MVNNRYLQVCTGSISIVLVPFCIDSIRKKVSYVDLCVLTFQILGPFLIFIVPLAIKIQMVEENGTLFLARSLKEPFSMIIITTANPKL